ncbi:unnamed protein product [Cylindrotheca closterium]|uniref:WD40 repeat-like protein n=1 Tax=Cylindrotheca closterium TaxID=2856 RepID=A0AAD2FRB4_9STRA|nr:unnamed protein product [Cylindrotheca closterium]
MNSANHLLTRKQQPLCSLVVNRHHGPQSPMAFARFVTQSFDAKELLTNPEIISPHQSSIDCLAVDKTNGRFLLAGSADGTVSIFDLSKWGSEHHIRQGTNNNSLARKSAFHPIARSIKVTAPQNYDIPEGHSSSVAHVQWYPVDSGAFLSTAYDGTLLFWDTNQMQPVLRVHPFDDDAGGGGIAHLQTGGDHSLIAAGSWNDDAIKLVDIRSGSHSHELSGHTDGISTLQWSPNMPVVLASGSKDGTVRLWDIRKSGSRACITVFNREVTAVSTFKPNKPYKADYAHLREKKPKGKPPLTKIKKRKRASASLAPNYYQHLQSEYILSHSVGHVGALKFFPNGHYLASIGGVDGDLCLWDLRTAGSPQRQIVKFVAPGGTRPSTGRLRKAPMMVTGPLYYSSQGSMATSIWVAKNHNILGFGMEGGSPQQVLKGHLNMITCIEAWEPGRRLVTGSRDGMILCWGKPSAMGNSIPILDTDADNW